MFTKRITLLYIMMIVKIDDSEFRRQTEKFSKRKLDSFIKKNINDMLFDLRKFAIDNSQGMASQFTVRQKGLLRRHFRVEKAIGLVGYFGSVDSPRFTGWTEQQKGTPVKRDYVVHRTHARGPGGKRKLAKKFRRNAPSENLLAPVRNSTGSVRQKITANIARLRRQRYSGAVTLPLPFGKMQPGVYKMLKSGRLKIMQIWRKKQPDRKKWLQAVVNNYFKLGKHNRIVSKNLERYLK